MSDGRLMSMVMTRSSLTYRTMADRCGTRQTIPLTSTLRRRGLQRYIGRAVPRKAEDMRGCVLHSPYAACTQVQKDSRGSRPALHHAWNLAISTWAGLGRAAGPWKDYPAMRLSQEKSRRLTAMVWRERARRWIPVALALVLLFAGATYMLSPPAQPRRPDGRDGLARRHRDQHCARRPAQRHRPRPPRRWARRRCAQPVERHSAGRDACRRQRIPPRLRPPELRHQAPVGITSRKSPATAMTWLRMIIVVLAGLAAAGPAHARIRGEMFCWDPRRRIPHRLHGGRGKR